MENIKPLLPSGKMSVTPQQSEILQKFLFENGYSWWSTHSTSIKHCNEPHLYWDALDLGVSYSGHDKEYFDKCTNELHLFEEHFNN